MSMLVLLSCAAVLLDAGLHRFTLWHALGVLGMACLALSGAWASIALLSLVTLAYAVAR